MKKKILLVEDNAEVRACISGSLEDYGHEVIACVNPKEALTLLETLAAFDVVITDYNMPEMNGIDFIAKLRDLGIWVPTYMLSATLDADVPVKANALKAKFLDKMQLSALIKEVRQ